MNQRKHRISTPTTYPPLTELQRRTLRAILAGHL